MLFLKEGILPEGKAEANKVKRLLDFGFLRTKSCTSALFLGREVTPRRVT